MTADLSAVPLVALSVETKQIISTLLNPPKVIPCEDGLPRDWRGLAHLSEVGGEIMPLLTSHSDPAAHIFSVWEQKNKNATIKDFQIILEKIDRWDVIDDTEALFENDAQKYIERMQRSKEPAENIVNNVDCKVLTVDDLYRLRQGLESQYYDAFLLYADADVGFANEMVEKLEKQYNLKLCLKDRDLIGGITFEHEAVMTLISERCNRLIVIVSPNFLKSSANQFFLNYAQALGIDKRQRKIIPCLFERCQLPPQLSYMSILDYNRAGLYDFWGKLRDSIQVPISAQKNKNCAPVTNNQSALEKKQQQFDNNVNMISDDTKSIKKLASESLDSLKLPDSQTTDDSGLKNFSVSDTNISENTRSETSENLIPENASNLEATTNKKHEPVRRNLLGWTKKKWNSKAANTKQEYRAISETLTIGSLPSLNGLDTLSTSTTSLDKKPKNNFLNKYVKKVQLKKVLVKS